MSTTKDPVLGKAVGRIPSGVYILCIKTADDSSAVMVSWVQQAAFEPLTLSIAMAKDRPAYALIQQGGPFTLSVLGQADTHLMKKYARGIKPGEDPFADVSVAHTPSGQPYLADALAWLECRLDRAVEFNADHDLLLAKVEAGSLLKEGPSFSHQRGSGWHY